MKMFITSVLSTLVVGLLTQVRAEDKTRAKSDTDFLIKAITCGTGGVKVSEYAAKHASNENVKDFAQRLARDHKALNQTITENARRLKVAVAAGLEKETKEHMDRLSKLKGNDFDVEYLQLMVDGHQKAIALFESESKNAEDPDLKVVAKNNLDTLKKHLQEAKDLLAKLKK